MQMLTGGALLLVAGTVAGEWERFSPAAVSLRSIAAFCYLTVFGSIVAFTAYNWLLRNVTAARVATYAYVNPLVAVFLGWALGGEAMTPRTVAAAVIITASVALITSYGKDGAEPPPSSADRRTQADAAAGEVSAARGLKARVPRPALGPAAREEGCG
jgi:drug/metabolite transporter (DMT)-like permease